MDSHFEYHRVRFGSWTFNFRHWYEFLYLYFEIFLLKEYFFASKTPTPLIIDCGGHIGLSTLFFKQIYPHAKIIIFEPHQVNIALLLKNLQANHIKNVGLLPVAVGSKNGEATFYAANKTKPSWGNTLMGKNSDQGLSKTKVKVAKLSKYLNQSVDLLKMDIEGTEYEVVQEISSKLKNVDQLIIELHHQPAAERGVILKLQKTLLKNKFKLKIFKPRRIILGELIDRLLHRPVSNIYMLHAWK